MLNPKEIADVVSKKKGTQAEKGLRNPQEVKLRGSAISEAFNKKAGPGEFGAAEFKGILGLKSVDEDKAYSEGSTTGTKQTGALGTYLTEKDYNRLKDSDQIKGFYADVHGEEAMKEKFADGEGLSINAFDALMDDLSDGQKDSGFAEPKKVQLSQEAAESKALVDTYDDHVMSGDRTEMIFGTNPVDGTTDRSGLDDFTFNYKQKVKELLVPTPVPGSLKKGKQG